MKDVDFKVFSVPANSDDGRVAAMRIPGGAAKLSRKQIDIYTEFVGDVLPKVMERIGAQDGDLVFFGADRAKVVNDSLAALRVKVGTDLDMIETKWSPMWVVDFPMFEKDEDNGRWTSLHHPFTAPKLDQVEELATNPANVLSRAYDMVLNGTELGGGSIRIHQTEVQKFLLDALRYGAPPHGGIAFGIDRIVAMMSEVESIRDVIAFPKTQKASCLLTDALFMLLSNLKVA